MRHEKRESTEKAAVRELTCELHGVPVKLPSAAKYKKYHGEKKTGPDLEVGKMAVIAEEQRGIRRGYYKAVLVDWDDEEPGWWHLNTRLYFVVLERSTSKIPDRAGRIVSARWPEKNWYSGRAVVSWNEKDFKKVD